MRPGGGTYYGALLRGVSSALSAPLVGRKPVFYGITLSYRRDPRPLREDLAILFEMLAQGRIKPLIAARLPLSSAREAQEMLERSSVSGKVVLLPGV